MHQIGICILTYNSQYTIEYVLKSITKQDYPKDYLYLLIVDGGSKDNTLNIINEFFSKSRDIKYDVIVASGTNILQARNICLDHMLRMHIDIVLFIDSDVIVASTNALSLLAKLYSEFHGIIHFAQSYRFFKDYESFRGFLENIASSEGQINSSSCSLKPVLEVGMGFTAVPIDLASKIRFNEYLDFGEDAHYALEALLIGYPVYCVECTKEYIFDVNFKDKGDIYWRMPVSRYLRGVREKATINIIKVLKSDMQGIDARKLAMWFLKHGTNTFIFLTVFLVALFFDLWIHEHRYTAVDNQVAIPVRIRYYKILQRV